MRLLDRYLLRELLIPLGYCLCGFLIFWISSDLFVTLGDFQRRGLVARDIAEYYAVVTPGFLVVVLPIALLLALLYALTNHSRHNEITAMRAAGVSLWRLSLPYLGVGLVASLALLGINELWAPQSDEMAKAILERHLPARMRTAGDQEVHNLCFNNSRDGRNWGPIGTYNPVTGEMIKPKIIWTRADGSRWIEAERAVPLSQGWRFYEVREFHEDPQKNSVPAPSLRTNVLTMREFTETRDEINSEIRISNSLTLRAARKADVPILDLLNYLHWHPDPSDSDGCWLYTKLQGRLAAPWTCLVVVLIALPFGVVSGRRNVFVGVAASILLCFAYFVLEQIGLALGTSGRLDPWVAAWFPNLSFSLTGLWLTARIR
jgi:lipopolysaccharide export system permease protein